MKRRLAVALSALALGSACDDSVVIATGGASSADATTGVAISATSVTGTTTASSTIASSSTGVKFTVCGDGVIEGGEQCEGTDFQGKTCESFGLGTGELHCNASCYVALTGCKPLENCTNGVDDNANGMPDCADAECATEPTCLDSCAAPQLLLANAMGDTSGRPADLAASCSSAMSGSEQVFAVTPTVSGQLVATVSSNVAIVTVSIRTSCQSDASELACAAGLPSFVTAKADVVANQTYYVMVDGETAADAGSFYLQVDVPLPESMCNNAFDDDLDGYLDCDDVDCQSQPACVPGAKATGAQCVAATECSANLNDPQCIFSPLFPGGYCSEFCDVIAQDCAAGAICWGGLGTSVHGVCLDSCIQDADCRVADGYACVDMGLANKVCRSAPESACTNYFDDDFNGTIDCSDPGCQPTAACVPGSVPIGQPCTANTDCAANTSNPVCLDEATLAYPGGYCSHFCDPITPDCGANAECAPLGPSGLNVCMQTCVSVGDCRPGYQCIFAGPPEMVCYP